MLILHYATVIGTFFCTYLGTVLPNRNELIPGIVKRITNANIAKLQFSCTKESSLTKKELIKIYKILIRPVAKYGAESWTLK